jgi:hypothetical protein
MIPNPVIGPDWISGGRFFIRNRREPSLYWCVRDSTVYASTHERSKFKITVRKGAHTVQPLVMVRDDEIFIEVLKDTILVLPPMEVPPSIGKGKKNAHYVLAGKGDTHGARAPGGGFVAQHVVDTTIVRDDGTFSERRVEGVTLERDNSFLNESEEENEEEGIQRIEEEDTEDVPTPGHPKYVFETVNVKEATILSHDESSGRLKLVPGGNNRSYKFKNFLSNFGITRDSEYPGSDWTKRVMYFSDKGDKGEKSVDEVSHANGEGDEWELV